jgi:hypothetical protein
MEEEKQRCSQPRGADGVGGILRAMMRHSLRPSALKGSLKVLLVHQASGTLGDVWRLIKLEGCVASAPTASFTFSKEMGLFLSMPVVKFKFMRG